MKNIKILVPTDLSDIGNKALRDAMVINSMFGGSITPMYVYNENEQLDNLIDLSDPANANRRIINRLDQKIREVASNYMPDYIIKNPIVVTGDVVDEILRASITHDMIVMSTHGRKGISRLMLGSVAKKVVRSTARPVVVVEETSELTPFNRILLTTDFSEYSKKVFPYAYEFAKASGATLDFVHMVYAGAFKITPDHEVVQQAKTKLEELRDEHFADIADQVICEPLITSVSINEAITNLVYSRDYQMVFMSTLGSTKLTNMIVGSVASSVIRMIDTAVLSINPRGKG